MREREVRERSEREKLPGGKKGDGFLNEVTSDLISGKREMFGYINVGIFRREKRGEFASWAKFFKTHTTKENDLSDPILFRQNNDNPDRSLGCPLHPVIYVTRLTRGRRFCS